MPIDGVSDSPILSLIDRIFEMRRQGAEILGLHIGEPDFDTPEGIREAASRALEQGETHYVAAQGLPELREAIASDLNRRCRLSVTSENVVVMPAKFAIFATVLSQSVPGDEVLLPNPTYLFEQPIQLVGGRPVYVPMTPDFGFDATAIQKAVTSRSRLLFLVTPGNPTGRVLGRGELETALAVAKRNQLLIVSDETYESLVYDSEHVAIGSLPGGNESVVTVGSFSKTFSMTGWRIGYAVGPPTVVSRLVKVMEHTLTCVPSFIQKACLWALQHAREDAEEFRRRFRKRRDRLLELLDDVPGLSYVKPSGAFYVFPRYDLPLPSIDFCSRLLAEEKLALVPGVAFGPAGERHVRISYSSPESKLEEGVRRLRRFLQRHRAS